MWPDKQTVTNKSIAVVVVTTILALVIALFDYLIGSGLSWLSQLLG